MTSRPLNDALMAATTLSFQLIEELVYAAYPGADRADAFKRLRRADQINAELGARIRSAELLFAAARPLEPVDSSTWTGRS